MDCVYAEGRVPHYLVRELSFLAHSVARETFFSPFSRERSKHAVTESHAGAGVSPCCPGHRGDGRPGTEPPAIHVRSFGRHLPWPVVHSPLRRPRTPAPLRRRRYLCYPALSLRARRLVVHDRNQR